MRPLALTTAASACDDGPMIAIDLPGAEPKVRPITTASQPVTTRAIAADILPMLRSRLVVIKMLNARTSGLEVLVDINQAVDSSLQTGAAKPGL